jgi:probable rRNA maturation factor
MIEITNLTSNPIEKNFFEKVDQMIEKEERKKGIISLVFVGPNRMRKLNKKYRGKNKVTDVLSFPEATKEFILPQKENLLGEIVVCPREIKKTSKRFNVSFEKELARVVIHGILHLFGYGHSTKDQEKIMEEKQNYYLQKLF